MKKVFLNPVVTLLTVVFLGSTATWAHSEKHGTNSVQRKISAEEHDFGREGDPQKVTRTIAVDMNDKMRFIPAEIAIKRGDTVRFVVKNSGRVMHEMVIGTKTKLKEHADLMKKHPNMEHDEAYMAHVKPGSTAPMVWEFTKAGEFYYGCLLPGHFEAGMFGKVIVK